MFTANITFTNRHISPILTNVVASILAIFQPLGPSETTPSRITTINLEQIDGKNCVQKKKAGEFVNSPASISCGYILIRSISVVVRLERAARRYTDIGSLFFGKNRQFRAELVEMQTGDFFVQVLRQDVNLILVLFTAAV